MTLRGKITSMRVAGIDDSGRGPVIGPLVIAGVLMDEEDLPKLSGLGVKDSKLLSPNRREELAEAIKKLSLEHSVIKLPPRVIDMVVETGRKYHRLNRLEAQTMAEVIAVLKPDVAYVDASDVVASRFKNHIIENLSLRVRVVSEHKADLNYPIVSAASIIAKVERDRAISELKINHGDLGSGYPTDPRTIKFLEDWITRFGTYPDFVRRSWKTAKRIKKESETREGEKLDS